MFDDQAKPRDRETSAEPGWASGLLALEWPLAPLSEVEPVVFFDMKSYRFLFLTSMRLNNLEICSYKDITFYLSNADSFYKS